MNIMPTNAVVNSPVVNNEFAELEIPRVIFMAMDGIPDADKYEMPDLKSFGGMYMPHIEGLRNSQYMLYRCALTQLPKFTPVADWDNMLPPEMRQHVKRSFTQTVISDGVATEQVIQGFMESDAEHIKKTGEFKNVRSNHVVFHVKYPGNEVKAATKRNAPHGVGGVVEIAALKGADAETIAAAQLFFFPKWSNIINGLDELPKTVATMEAHLRSRVDQIDLQPWSDEKKKTYRDIAKDMLRSCSEFKQHGQTIASGDEITYKHAFEKGDTTVRHSDISDKVLEQTEKQRKSDMAAAGQDATNSLVTEMRAEREAKAAMDAKAFLLEERKQYTAEIAAGLRERDLDEEVRLGMRKAETPQQPLPPAVIPTPPAPFTGTVENEREPSVTRLEDIQIADDTATVELAPVNMHDPVSVAGRAATVVGKPFGKVKVKYDDDGTEETVQRGQLD